MTEARRKYGYRTSGTTPVTPINLRMPTALRSRLRRFAEERNVGEADALRLIVSERLSEAERDRDLSEAERWQLAQVYDTLQRRKRRRRRSVSQRDIERTFAEALEAAKQKRVR